jgi:hypothetical protein
MLQQIMEKYLDGKQAVKEGWLWLILWILRARIAQSL